MTKKQIATEMLEVMIRDCANDMIAVGIPVRADRIYEINIRPIRGTRACVFFGTNLDDGLMSFSLCIHNKMLQNLDNAYAIANIKNSIYHELLHTCENCQSHNDEWMKWSKYCDEKLGTNTRLHLEEDVYYSADVAYVTYVCPVCGSKYLASNEHSMIHCSFCENNMHKV